MTVVGAAFIDLDRVARAMDGIGAEATHTLAGGTYRNVSRYLDSERWTVNHVLEAVRASPQAFTGATDHAAAEQRLVHALAQVDAAAIATTAAAKVGLLKHGRDLSAAVPLLRFTEPDAVAGAAVLGTVAGGAAAAHGVTGAATTSAADDVRAAQALLGGRRDLPELAQLPPGAPLVVPDGRAVEPADSKVVRGTGHRVLQAIGRGALHAGLAKVAGIHAINESTVPATGGVLVAPTHGSFVDPGHTISQLHRPVRSMINQDFLDVPVLGTVLRAFGGYGVRHGNAAEGLRDARGVLADGQASLLYPESMLIRGDWVGSHRNGLAELALQMHVPIVPVATYGAKPRALRGEGWGRPLVSLAFGDLIDPGRAAYTPSNVEILREQVARAHDALLPQVQADHAARRATALAHRPWVFGGTAAAGLGAGALELRLHHDGD